MPARHAVHPSRRTMDFLKRRSLTTREVDTGSNVYLNITNKRIIFLILILTNILIGRKSGAISARSIPIIMRRNSGSFV